MWRRATCVCIARPCIDLNALKLRNRQGPEAASLGPEFGARGARAYREFNDEIHKEQEKYNNDAQALYLRVSGRYRLNVDYEDAESQKGMLTYVNEFRNSKLWFDTEANVWAISEYVDDEHFSSTPASARDDRDDLSSSSTPRDGADD